MMPSVLPVISTPMNLFFSHLPACVEASAWGICRASDSINVMACSAVVIELPNGVFIRMMPLGVGGAMSNVPNPVPAPPSDLRAVVGACEDFRRYLGGGTHCEAVELADNGSELVLVLAEIGLEIDVDAAVLENLNGRRRKGIGDENARSHGVACRFYCCGRRLCVGSPSPEGEGEGASRRLGRGVFGFREAPAEPLRQYLDI